MERIGGGMNRACCLITVGLAIALAACGTGRSDVAPEPAPVLADSRGVPSAPSASVRPGGPPRPDRPGMEAGSAPTSAALNLRLLQRVSRTENTDLPVGAGDLLEVSVFEVEELSKIRLRVPRRGVISLPLIGQIQATGRTTAELEEEIRARLQRKFMHDPQVSVFLQEHNSQRISVIGAVRKGGVFNLNRPLRLADALALAEGLTEEADRQVYVIRRAPIGAVTAAADSRGTGPS